MHPNAFLAAFIGFISLILLLDLGALYRQKKEPSVGLSLLITALWVVCAILFAAFLWWKTEWLYPEMRQLSALEQTVLRDKTTLEFLTAYLLEYALSVDNLFVMLLIFSRMGVAKRHYHQVLFWGILGAMLLRFIFIFSGSGLIHEFEWMLYVFGIVLLYSGFKIIKGPSESEEELKKNTLLNWLSKHLPFSSAFSDGKFWITEKGKFLFTRLFLVLLMIEFTDVLFAFDSIPAIFGVSHDPYVIFFSNVFAIAGLRSLFYSISKLVAAFSRLQTGLGILLILIGIKMCLGKIPEQYGFTAVHSLLMILGIVGATVLWSVIETVQKENKRDSA